MPPGKLEEKIHMVICPIELLRVKINQIFFDEIGHFLVDFESMELNWANDHLFHMI